MVLIYRASVGTTGRCVFTKFRGCCAVFFNRNHSRSVADCKCLSEPCLLWGHSKALRAGAAAGQGAVQERSRSEPCREQSRSVPCREQSRSGQSRSEPCRGQLSAVAVPGAALRCRCRSGWGCLVGLPGEWPWVSCICLDLLPVLSALFSWCHVGH